MTFFQRTLILVRVPHHAFDREALTAQVVSDNEFFSLAQEALERLQTYLSEEEILKTYAGAVYQHADGYLEVDHHAPWTLVSDLLTYGLHAVDIWHAGNEKKLWGWAETFYAAKAGSTDPDERTGLWNEFRRRSQTLGCEHLSEFRLLAALAAYAKGEMSRVGGAL